MDKIEFIRKNVDRRTLLEQMAEECAELGQACIKLIRAEGLNQSPTPVTPETALSDLLTEASDICMILTVLGYIKATDEIMSNAKWDRWVNRLKQMEVKRTIDYVKSGHLPPLDGTGFGLQTRKSP